MKTRRRFCPITGFPIANPGEPSVELTIVASRGWFKFRGRIPARNLDEAIKACDAYGQLAEECSWQKAETTP